ncbi:MAG TPA: endolytic transglycosylase MltG [Burkholderiales bacterium]|nr:endolytic transglycosylase MltG [Burkholderiales bacterium]
MFRALKYLFLLTCLALLAAAGWLWWFAHEPLRLAAPAVEFTIAQGSSLRAASRVIARAGVEMPPLAFEVVARTAAKPGEIKAGTYEVTLGTTPLELLGKLTRGEFALVEVKFIEGWTFRQLREALDGHPHVRHDTKGLPDAAVLERLGLSEPHPEGLFFPDTYRFARGTSDIELLRTANRALAKRLDAAWADRRPDLPLTSPYEALILASIVEKETGKGDDRTMVAAVFVNRLRGGMKLQADPTVIYGLGDKFDGNLRKRDLVTDTPYNTYTRDGLPPTPIALPGLASIAAATNPAASDALYFVARGDGSSEFSRTLEEHNRAVAKYQRGGRP